MYFIDNTEFLEISKKFQETQTCMGIIMIDSYEELIQSLGQEERTQVTTEIETKIYEWASKIDGVALKSDRDRFVVVFEQKYIDQIIENKFEILKETRSIETEGVIPTTLSVAICSDGNTNSEKFKLAMETMDLVLGRGGDQAAIRRNEKYEFYGGKKQETEKRTKVKAKTVATALEELIEEAPNIAIMGHSNGDIDSMGSSLGIYRIVKSLGKTAKIVNNTYGMTLKDFIEAVEQEEEYKDVIIDKSQALNIVTSDTLLIIVDTHKKSYVEVPELLTKTNKIVVIDHHRRGPDYIDNAILMFHEVYASSAAELVAELLQYTKNNAQLTTFEAESLYAGIMVDTKNFTFKTGVRTFEAAAYLRKNDIDIIKVKKWFQSDLESYNVIADVVKNTEVIRDTIGMSEYLEEDENTALICAKAADELLTISDITASFVIGKLRNTVYISGRSIGDINVQLVLEKMRRWRTPYCRRCTNHRYYYRRSKKAI
ncbi:MAG: DHH family phosphoesterase, partial [Clostridia bacterium]|nr:DHH family phosphoesterase [Clostridia bacterium]